jgi:hypothetical protein
MVSSSSLGLVLGLLDTELEVIEASSDRSKLLDADDKDESKGDR